MAEGFLQPDDGDMESLGSKFINILLHNSLLQVLQDLDRNCRRNVEICSMHDLVHDLACSVLGTSRRANCRSRVRYMILPDGFIDRREMKHCRTLLMENRVSGIMFSHFECLHVLTLRSYGDKKLPSSIRKLIHLRKLNISYTSIESLPEWIGELHYLQTLRAELGRLKMPKTVKYLTNMRHLYLKGSTVLPAGIGGLTCLQTLKYFGVGDENGGCKIEELGGLNDLKGELEILNLEGVHGKEEAAKANLFRKSKIMELGLIWDHKREGEIENDENVLEGLQPHTNLNKLSVRGFKGKRFPPWTVKMAVQNVPAAGSWVGLNKLTNIDLSQCTECEEIPMLGHLPNLKSLRLQMLSNVKRINSSGMPHIVFPALERLVLDNMPKLAQVVSDCGSDDVQVFPRLQYLQISGCEQLMRVGTHLLPCLEHLTIGRRWGSMPVANIFFQIKCELLAQLDLFNISALEFLPDWLFHEKPNLSKISIIQLPKLREVPPGLLTLSSSLEELIIENCPLLERITSGDGGLGSSFFFFTSLRSINIQYCDALVWLARELVGPSLEVLRLKSLSSLKNLPNLIDDCMARSSRLNTLLVYKVPIIMATCRRPVEDWHFGSLQRLDMNACDVEGKMETVDGILQGCRHSLMDLTMIGTGDCDCRLPESMGRLTALCKLKLVNLGMEELPEWFGNLSSLKSLHIRGCRKLRRLPSMDAMSRLQRLTFLNISGCPELLAQGVADPEWPKVSHIFCITLNSTRLIN